MTVVLCVAISNGFMFNNNLLFIFLCVIDLNRRYYACWYWTRILNPYKSTLANNMYIWDYDQIVNANITKYNLNINDKIFLHPINFHDPQSIHNWYEMWLLLKHFASRYYTTHRK